MNSEFQSIEDVISIHQKPTKTPLPLWLEINPLPAFAEPKFQGKRAFLFLTRKSCVIALKNKVRYHDGTTPRLAQLFDALKQSFKRKEQLILDGELIEKSQQYFIFDILYATSKEDAFKKPLWERKELLAEQIIQNDNVQLVPHRLVKSEAAIYAEKEVRVKQGYEGVVVKNPLADYKQPSSWLKLRHEDTADVFVTDFEEGKEHSYYVGVYREGFQVLRPLGKVGTAEAGVDFAQIKKGTVLEIKYHQISEEGNLVDAWIIGIRDDKTPEQCTESQFDDWPNIRESTL